MSLLNQAARTAYNILPAGTRRCIQKTFRRKRFDALQRLRSISHRSYSLAPFDRYGCIFVHVPKTGGVSIAKSLFGCLAGYHIDLSYYQCIFDSKEFRTYFKFAFVRNPWDRLVSAYHYLKEGGMFASDRKWAERNLSSYPDFEKFVKGWVNRGNVYTYRHFIPQHEFLRLRSGVPEVDFIGRFENLEGDFDTVKKRLGIEAELPAINATRSRKKDYREYFTPEMEKIVNGVYRRDIDLFGYRFEDGPKGSSE